MKKKARKIRYGVVGLGNIAQGAVLPAFEHAADSELCALVSGDARKLEAMGKQYGIPHTACGDYRALELLIETAKLDAVYIAVPNAQHKELTLRSLKAGAHVLCEKPMAVDEKECRAMIQAARRHEKKLMIAYRLHFETANLTAINAVTKGEIGEPRIFTATFTQEVRPGDIRTDGALGGGALYDVGVYCINAARYMFRAEPEQVMAMSSYGHDARFKDVEEMTSALLRFPGGRLAQLTASQGAAAVSQYRVIGTTGDIHVEPAFGYHRPLSFTLTRSGRVQRRSFAKGDQFAPELEYFSHCILHDLEPEPSGEEGLADVRILRAIRESARTGKAVTLRAFTRSHRPTMRLAQHKAPPKKTRLVHAPAPTHR